MKRYMWLLIGVLLALLLASVGGAAAEPVAPVAAPASFIPGEPNDTFESAIPYDFGKYSTEGYFLFANDVDFYRIDTATALRLHVRVETGQAYGQTAMTAEIAVYDANRALLAEDVACDDPAEVDGVVVPPGTAYLRARPCAAMPDIDHPYELYVYGEPLEWEPNNTRQTANAAVMGKPYYYAGEEWLQAAVSPDGDVDFYRLPPGRGRVLSAWALPEEGAGLVTLTAMAADGTVVAEGAACWWDANEVCLETILPDEAAYFLRVRSAAHPTGGGGYSLHAQFTMDVSDPEPNDTPAQAPLIGYGTTISLWTADENDVDYYKFAGNAGDKVRLTVQTDYEGLPETPGLLGITLLDPAMNPVPLAGDPVHSAVLPATGVYTVRISLTYAAGDWDWIDVVLEEGGIEPNDTRETAMPIAIGPELDIVFDYPCDVDWFVFEGRAGDVLRHINTLYSGENVTLYSADGTRLWNQHVLPADGTYYLKAIGYDGSKFSWECYDGEKTKPFGEALWVSAAVDGLGGAANKRGDILTRKSGANQWQIVFDASDVGITKNVNAFERMPNGSILMSLAAAQNVAGLGKVQPQDIIRFNPTSLGDTTAGTFEWFLDGSDVGLTTAGEKIDAIYMQQDIENPLRISLTGSGSVARVSGGTLKVADEDILNLVGGVFGANSAGAWRTSLDGSAVPGLAKEDISNLARVEVYPAHDSVLLLGLDSAFTVNGTSGTMFDVMNGDTWLPAVRQLTNKKIDGLAVGPAQTP